MSDGPQVQLNRELVLIMSREIHVATSVAAAPTIGHDAMHPVSRILAEKTLGAHRIFGTSFASLAPGAPDVFAGQSAMTQFFSVTAHNDGLEDLARELSGHPEVEAAYIKPAIRPPVLMNVPAALEGPVARTPDFSSDQGYLSAAPIGVDAVFAHSLNGGRGAGVNIIDIEGAWRLSHEDLSSIRNGFAGGDTQTDINWRNHGTAVLGVMGASANGVGCIGIAPDAIIRTIAAFKQVTAGLVPSSATAIAAASELLSAGDILLIELHRPGPRFNFSELATQEGYIPIEWWPDDYLAISAAVAKGIIVVEAGGNGAEGLDDNIYDAAPAPPFGPFPAWWSNPLRRNPLDTGAIIVGAGAPPPNTHGRSAFGPDRARLPFSNYGESVDVQGWGREVTSTGYGDKQGGVNEDLWYTDQFSGTSSASPIIAGVLACLCGVIKQQNGATLTPKRARELLRTTGSPQVARPGQSVLERIGNRPDLRQLVDAVCPAPPNSTVVPVGVV